MNFNDSRSFMHPQSDAIGVWPQFPMNNVNEQHFDPISQFENHQPPFKRLRSQSDESRLVPLPNLPINKVTSMFFKTKMCAKFRTGSCRNGESCNYAHGMQDLRQPPPNWQELLGGRGEESNRVAAGGNWDDDQRIIHKMKLCKKFCSGEECQFGDRYNFLHENPSKFRDDVGKFRESSVISIGTTGQPNTVLNVVENNKPPLNNGVTDGFRGNMKPVYWKTKLCIKWDTTGHCHFGDDCHYAHGQAVPAGRVDGEIGNFASSKPPVSANNLSQTMSTNVPGLIDGPSKKCLLKFKGPKKINRIYGDWLDDLPLLQNFANQVES